MVATPAMLHYSVEEAGISGITHLRSRCFGFRSKLLVRHDARRGHKGPAVVQGVNACLHICGIEVRTRSTWVPTRERGRSNQPSCEQPAEPTQRQWTNAVAGERVRRRAVTAPTQALGWPAPKRPKKPAARSVSLSDSKSPPPHRYPQCARRRR